MAIATLYSDRLLLRPLRIDDARAMHVAMSDKELMTWWSSRPHVNVDETRDYVTINATSDNYMTWAITMNIGPNGEKYEGAQSDEAQSDEALGWVVFVNHREGVKEIGYILRRSHQGRGIAREAVRRVIEHGLDDLDLRKIIADTDPDNLASNDLLIDMGFQKEGYLREEWHTHLGVRDSILWGMLKSEYNRV